MITKIWKNGEPNFVWNFLCHVYIHIMHNILTDFLSLRTEYCSVHPFLIFYPKWCVFFRTRCFTRKQILLTDRTKNLIQWRFRPKSMRGLLNSPWIPRRVHNFFHHTPVCKPVEPPHWIENFDFELWGLSDARFGLLQIVAAILSQVRVKSRNVQGPFSDIFKMTPEVSNDVHSPVKHWIDKENFHCLTYDG